MKDTSPSDIEAEKVLLGGLFLNNELFFEDAEDLNANDFSLDSHKQVFAVVASILLGEVDSVTTADFITVSSELRRRGDLDKVGGISYLASLTEGMPRKPSLRDYVGIVRAKAKLRKLIAIGSNLVHASTQVSSDPDVILDNVRQSIFEVEAEETGSAVQIGAITPIIETAVMKGRDLSINTTEVDLTWGIEALDDRTKGAFFGELTVIGGDSGGGKTQAVVQMAVENAKKGRPVLLFSMEMSKEKMAQRAYPLMDDGLSAALMRDPRGMSLHTHVPALRRASVELSRLPIYIDDTAPLSLTKFIARCKSYTRKYGIELVIADYLQLFQYPGRPEDRIPGIMFGCRDYIKTEKKQHLVLLSQFSQGSGLTRSSKKSKADLYGGAVIHQAAQNVLIITVEKPERKEPGSDLDVEIMIAKQREGITGKVMCRRSATSLKYIPAPPEPEKKPDEQRKRNTDAKQRTTGGSRRTKGESQGDIQQGEERGYSGEPE